MSSTTYNCKSTYSSLMNMLLDNPPISDTEIVTGQRRKKPVHRAEERVRGQETTYVATCVNDILVVYTTPRVLRIMKQPQRPEKRPTHGYVRPDAGEHYRVQHRLQDRFDNCS